MTPEQRSAKNAKQSNKLRSLDAAGKAARAAYQRAWRLAHPDIVKAIRAKRKEKEAAYKKVYMMIPENRERARQWERDNHKRNPSKNMARKKRFYERNREKCLAIHRAWKDKNRDAIKAYERQYYKANRVRLNLYARVKMHVRKSTKKFTVDDVSRQLRGQKFRCWWCTKKLRGNQYHIDHRIPLAKGGENDARNIVIACPHCNLSKHTKMPHEFAGVLL